MIKEGFSEEVISKLRLEMGFLIHTHHWVAIMRCRTRTKDRCVLSFGFKCVI